MRVKFKFIVLAAIGLAALQAGLKLSKTQQALNLNLDLDAGDAPVKVSARESQLLTSITSIAPVPVTNWSTQLGAVLTTQASTTNKAIGLLGMFPNLPAPAQVEAAQHASRLMPDNYYGALGAQMTNTAAAPAARRAIFADLLTRPNSVKLPWLVAVASASLDEQSDEAALLLRSQLNEDHGTNWPLWRERVAQWLTRNPDPAVPGIAGTSVSN